MVVLDYIVSVTFHPPDTAHPPHERKSDERIERGIRAIATLWDELGK